MNTQETLEHCKRILQSHYGNQFRGLVLFGSSAREQARFSSDIDVLVLLDGTFDFFRELRSIVELLYDVQLQSDRLISAKPASLNDYQRGKLQLYRTAKREGSLV